MKVFISWSGELSQKVALILRDWLPSVIQAIIPYVSSEDIDKGARWNTEISKELEEASFGILCITPSNLNAPWINFEAGAISKYVEKGQVVPLLINLKRSEIVGPLLQFQSVIIEKEDIKKLIHSLNKTQDPPILNETRLDDIFNVWFPELEQKLDSAIKEYKTIDKPIKKEDLEIDRRFDEILEEILETVRNQQRSLSNPEQLLPKEYLINIFNEISGSSYGSSHIGEALGDIYRAWSLANKLIDICPEENKPSEELIDAIKSIKSPLRYIMNRTRMQKARSDFMFTTEDPFIRIGKESSF